MGHLRKAFRRLAPHPLGGGIRGQQLRVLRLQLLQPAELVVEVIIGHGGRVQHIILVARLGQVRPKHLNFLLYIHGNVFPFTSCRI